jgi:TRAP-type C4-dicarboxylate transport system permease small subunit
VSLAIFIDRMTRLLEGLLAALLFAMFAMVITLVVLRYGFATTIIGGNEATIIAFIYTTAIGASIALSRDEHIAIAYFVEKLSPSAQLNLLKLRLSFLVIINVFIAAYALIWIQKTGGFMMPMLGAPQWVAQISVPLGCGLSAFYCLCRLVVKSTPALSDGTGA